MRFSIPVALTTIITAVSVVGLVLIASATNDGAAPGSGQQTFDAPGCEPSTYDGPGRRPRYLLVRNCPRPTVVILRHVRRSGTGWVVDLDASRSFDPMGGRIVRYEWSVEGRPRKLLGPRVSARFENPGAHKIVLGIIDNSGLNNEGSEVVRLR